MNNQGETPLMLTVAHGGPEAPEVIVLLREYGADPYTLFWQKRIDVLAVQEDS